jgi:hypothetical protein
MPWCRKGRCVSASAGRLPKQATPANARRFAFCTDDRVPGELLDDGSIDALVRMATGSGLDPLIAITMATLNAAEHYGLRDRGAVVRVPAGHVWREGDNPLDSHDSRAYGAVPAALVQGRSGEGGGWGVGAEVLLGIAVFFVFCLQSLRL